MLEYGGFALSALAGAVGAALWLYATGKLSGVTQATVAAKVGDVERRQDEAGRRLSDLTSKLMILPGTMSTMQDEQMRQRAKMDKMADDVAELRVGMARLEERHRIENGRKI